MQFCLHSITEIFPLLVCLSYVTAAITWEERAAGDSSSAYTKTKLRNKRQVFDGFCQKRQDGKIYADPNNCRSYVYCSGGYSYRSTCTPGLYYDPKKQACEFDKGQCSGKKKGTIKENQRKQPTENEVIKRVVKGKSRQQTTRVIQTRRQPNVNRERPRISDATNRRLDLQNSTPKNRNSPTVFGSFSGRTGTPRPTIAEVRVTRPPSRHFDKATFCKNRESGVYQHPSDCRGYVQCYGGTSFPAQCPPGLIFSKPLKGCDFDLEGICDITRKANEKTRIYTTFSNNEFTPDTSTTRSRFSVKPTARRPISSQSIGVVTAGKLSKSMPGAIEHALTALTDKLKKEAQLSKTFHGKARPFKLVQRFLRAKPLAKQLSMPAFVLTNASQRIIHELGMDSKKGMSMLEEMHSPLPVNTHRVSTDDPLPQPDPGTCPWPTYNCRIAKYRSFDGSCNNLQKALQGRSFTPLKRYLHPDYADDMGSLRKARDGNELPEARRVSFTISEDKDSPHKIHTLMLMQWGQFLDHDLSLTAITKMVTDASGFGKTVDIECGSDGCSQSHEACAPMIIPPNDPNFFGKKCLEFVRSQEVPNLNCTIGARQQLNQINSYIDGSNVYGASREEANALRDLTQTNRGKLKYKPHPSSPNHKYLLPTKENDKDCRGISSQEQCFKAGDERVNEQNGLTVMHTLWLREHNRIESHLNDINPQWDGETLYQESRRIIGAMMQQITFNEFLPVILGSDEIKKYGLNLLKSGYYTGYVSHVDASISNVFATAAFRFGHSMLQPAMKRTNSNFATNSYPSLKLSEMFFRPNGVYSTNTGGVDGLLRGLCDQQTQSIDRYVTQEVTIRLFSDNPPNQLGTDLVSLNIQRGRDHGIPGYNKWREWCGLTTAKSFNDMIDIPEANVRNKFRSLYRYVDDIDLFPAGLAERPVNGGLLGPTFACIVGRQFSDSRKGDRFWFESNGANRFTADQLKEIRKVTLAKVVCSNGDEISKIQPRVMELPFREAYPNIASSAGMFEKHGLNPEWFSRLWMANYNARSNCSCLPDIDFKKWKS